MGVSVSQPFPVRLYRALGEATKDELWELMNILHIPFTEDMPFEEHDAMRQHIIDWMLAI